MDNTGTDTKGNMMPEEKQYKNLPDWCRDHSFLEFLELLEWKPKDIKKETENGINEHSST